jgi:protein TonB
VPSGAEAAPIAGASDEAVDFGDVIVADNRSTHGGAVRHAEGTSKHAVDDVGARAQGRPKVTAAAPAPDRSRPPALVGGLKWDCPFPGEADAEGINHAVVTLRVELDQRGNVLRSMVAKDPGSGFGREARRCARLQRWSPGLDRAGNPIAAETRVIVRFDR